MEVTFESNRTPENASVPVDAGVTEVLSAFLVLATIGNAGGSASELGNSFFAAGF
jgi:hypothetical protein